MGEFADLTTGEHRHIPVLLNEVLLGLAVQPGGRYLDATVGGGGHATAILEAAFPDGQLLGLDCDPEAALRAAKRLSGFDERARVVHASYSRLQKVAEAAGWLPSDGVLFDLGFSSWQVDAPERGFAFRLDGPLDMRFDTSQTGPSAADLVNSLSEFELENLLRQYGEETRSRRIVRAIVAARPITTTQHLAEVILKALGRGKREPLHPATRTFQALRIAVNRELDVLTAALPQAVATLRPGGRLAVITFHSLEDRIVKHFFKQEARGCICPPKVPVCMCGRQPTLKIVTQKAQGPSPEEVAANPRSRSAKLRVAEKLCDESVSCAS